MVYTLPVLLLSVYAAQAIVLKRRCCRVVQRGQYHRFKITEAGSEILKAGSNSISIVGSEFFILVTGTSTATIRIGWKGVVNPSRYFNLVTTLFEGIMEELVRGAT